MTCLEAQSKIMAFIDNQLNNEELEEFVRHIKSCKNCSDELEIYYTLLVGMKQLDNNENLSTNFKDELAGKLDSSIHQLNSKRHRRASSLLIFAILLLAAGLFGYNRFLAHVYDKEQEIKLLRQSDYYFYDSYQNVVFEPHRIQIREFTASLGEPEKADPTSAFYEQVRAYNRVESMREEMTDE